MRIRIVFDLQGKMIPVNYRSILSGILYAMLPLDESTTKLHNDGEKLENRKFKLFTFSEIYGTTSYDKNSKSLIFLSNGCLDVTSYHEEIVMNIVNYIEENKNVLFGKQIISILKYDILNDYCDRKSEATYYTVSPITIYKTEGKQMKFFSPEQDEFKIGIIKNISQKYFLCYQENMPDITITSIENVSHKRVHFRKTLYEAYHCSLTFFGLTEKIQKVIMTSGICPKNALGFGMVSRKL